MKKPIDPNLNNSNYDDFLSNFSLKEISSEPDKIGGTAKAEEKEPDFVVKESEKSNNESDYHSGEHRSHSHSHHSSSSHSHHSHHSSSSHSHSHRSFSSHRSSSHRGSSHRHRSSHKRKCRLLQELQSLYLR